MNETIELLYNSDLKVVDVKFYTDSGIEENILCRQILVCMESMKNDDNIIESID